MLVWGEADSETLPKRSLRRKLFKTCCMNWKEVNLTHAYYNGSCTIKDTEDPSWSTSFKTRRTQKTSSALEALWKTLFVLYLYLIGTLWINLGFIYINPKLNDVQLKMVECTHSNDVVAIMGPLNSSRSSISSSALIQTIDCASRNFFTSELLTDVDTTSLWNIAKTIHKLEFAYGLIPNVRTKGKASVRVADMLNHAVDKVLCRPSTYDEEVAGLSVLEVIAFLCAAMRCVDIGFMLDDVPRTMNLLMMYEERTTTKKQIHLGDCVPLTQGNGYSLKDKNKAKTDKTEHENGKSVKSQNQSQS
ncbi:multidrug resistance-associated protein 5 [Tanacetum coccineum]